MVVTDNRCNMPCAGNSSEVCGGPNGLTVFYNGLGGIQTNPGPTGWGSLGCYTDSTGGRTLTTGMAVQGGASAMTVALCTSACKQNGFTYAGVEYANECYCGNTLSNGGGPASDSSGCNMACAGNASEFCGGSNRLNVYKLGATASSGGPSSTAQGSGGDPPSTASTIGQNADPSPATDRPSTISTATVTPSLTVVNGPSATGLSQGWSSKGCYVDAVNGRILPTQVPADNTMTVESCVSSCVANGYSVAGMEYASQCFCGNQIIQGGTKDTANPSGCNMNCAGNANEICGGPNRMSIYSNYTGTVPVIQPPVQQNTSLPGNWKYVGCLTDAAGGATRTFPWQIILPQNNSAQNCLSQCSAYGYGRGGMEYGDECYCGDLSDVEAAKATLTPDTDCNMICSGNASYFCGAGNRISYYAWQGSGLPQFNYPTGSAAGAYQFLIGAPIIPLIATPAINGKVVFVEKYGTEPAANSTGTYELDLSLLNNYSKAFRALHVKTDVFCSAGLVLPDRAGRHINVGGWSANSLYGVRLYAPSGQPGTAGTTDWQENYQELFLQNGRWYPSAMLLTNGSILVVGGENGSNGAAVPTLEILPKPAGGTTMFLDFLNRTDPNNLYPYLAVLPSSGNVFIAYYNEARILDTRTFATVKTLPNIPGQVTNNASGRTYPFEGTSVLLPQRAPYTDPLTILICGGANPGLSIGIDNCVSIQPEAANPTWALERMPSGRVMSCIAALPDGTYLINNGAHKGVAGFGLGTDPNLNAVLYDPSKPFNQRMSVMANTTVARMYHSESVLLDDGRVLVSGSDPEDPRYPQEYRMEVFMPPYLLSGKPRPSYTIASTNRDWSYGGSYQITNVKLPNGGPASVTLLGAVASTHGNSMGQRTIMPAVSCSGTTCTITAPPNVKVAPAGWFQVWLMDNGIPSNASWVRIGGDPGSLGNWPKGLADFTTPGVGTPTGYIH